MSDNNAPLILIDGSSWLFRAYHVLPPFTNSAGEPTGAIYGMTNMLRKFLREYASDRIVVVFDPPGKTFRNDMFADYKANRPPVPEDLSAQFDGIKAVVQALGLPLLQVSGVEADDVIGTLAARADGDVLVVTGDKDMAQLVNERVQLLDTMKDKRMDVAGVNNKFGVGPELITAYLALVGDTADNIPGVTKVGPKTAVKWLSEYGSLQGVMDHADTISGKVADNLRAALDALPLYQDLTTIRCGLDLGSAGENLQRQPVETGTLAALYREFEFYRFLEDLDDTADTQPQTVVEVDYRSVLDDAALEELASALEAADIICLDTETDALSATRSGLVGLSFAVAQNQAWYVPLAHDYLDAPAQLDWAMVRTRLAPILEDANRPKVGQNLKYDYNVLRRHGITLAGIDHDTMLASYVVDSTATRHDMDSLAQKYLNRSTTTFTDIAGKGKKQLTFNQIALEQALPYAAEDADITLQLHQLLHARLEAEPQLARVYRDIEMPLLPVLADMEADGVLVDAALLGRISAELSERMSAIETRAYETAGGEFNLGSPAQLKTVLFDTLGLPVRRKTPKGAPSTAEDVLHDLAAEHDLPHMILEWRELSKLRSTYADKLPQQINPVTGRIHTSYHQAVAATGRLSSSDPNLQNIPIRTQSGRRIRDAFIAPPGHRLVAVDYSQIELRIMAHLSADPMLLAAFNENRDIHAATAAEVFATRLDEVTTDQRRAAKAINFGLMYGMSAFGLARQIGTTREQASAYIDRFFERFAGVREFMDSTRAAARDKGYVETWFGRRLYLPEINARNGMRRAAAERTAINAPLQGTAADLIKKAMIDVHTWLAATGEPTRMIMQVHDELIFEVPDNDAERLAAALRERMCAVTRLDVPLLAEAGIGYNWEQAH